MRIARDLPATGGRSYRTEWEWRIHRTGAWDYSTNSRHQAQDYPRENIDPNTGGSLTEVTIGNNIYGGTATATLQVGPGALSSGNTEALVFTLIVNADPNYYPTHLSLGPNAINASTPFTVDFKA